jgi:protein TonB
MKNRKKTWTGKIRFFVFLFAVLLHVLLLVFVAFRVEITEKAEEVPANVMRLVDVREETPLPPPPPPPLREIPPENFQNTVEAVAETMVETDEVPDEVITGAVPYADGSGAEGGEEQIDFLPMSRISVLPVFPEDQIRRAIVYPPIALRSGIEGTVYLELFVDRQGAIRQISILRETPPGRGFGEAAISAFKGIRGAPAESNGQKVAVRFRYPVRFTIK